MSLALILLKHISTQGKTFWRYPFGSVVIDVTPRYLLVGTGIVICQSGYRQLLKDLHNQGLLKKVSRPTSWARARGQKTPSYYSLTPKAHQLFKELEL